MSEPPRNETNREQNAAAAPAPAAEERRGALRKLVTVGGLAYAGAVAVPGACFLFGSPAPGDDRSARGSRPFARVARLADLREGEPRRVQVRGDERDAFTVNKDQLLGSVWIVRRGEAVQVYSATCPHLGCSVDLDAGGSSFACPCHTSKFALDGAVVSGPSPRGLDPLSARVVDGFVEIAFARFRQGTADRVETPA